MSIGFFRSPKTENHCYLALTKLQSCYRIALHIKPKNQTMEKYMLVLGPQDLSTLIENAKSTGKLYLIKVELEIDEAKREIVENSIVYYPIDNDLKSIGSEGKGCPYPPNCRDIQLKLAAGVTVTEAEAEICKQSIKTNAAGIL